ncbi:MAG TPA: methylated-DNA--[protein]-cysteine S-methyltransferase, partial [Bryobacteraceae bacterium]|nr:methylated-DNA--[protein]-cysteine S-methyltransferase [Bryobacteraceae bacterium]
GVTPKQFAAAARAERVRAALRPGKSVTHAMNDAGYNSSSRFYSESQAILGMKPKQFADSGNGAVIRFAVGECSLGSVLAAASSTGVCAIFLGSDPDQLVKELQRRFRKAVLVGGDAAFERVVAAVVGLVENPGREFELPMDVRGTAFQREVWQALTKIPAGETCSYLEIAKRIGREKSSRAVAQACGANLLAVAIPCHRVVRRDGDLSGYRWGVDRKRALLLKEKAKRQAR